MLVITGNDLLHIVETMLRPTWLLGVTVVFGDLLLRVLSCGHTSCHPIKEGYINVHIIAHTHDDVGWVKTVDQYYYGGEGTDYGGVKQILKSSFQSLLQNRNRRFIYVESAFLFKWWIEQKPLVQRLFKELVDVGQLELVSGGWSMNDEATTNYQSIIDQFTLGLSQLNDTFGACGRPKVGWQIDPFGHSSEMASIFAHLGFDGLFLGRIDYQDKQKRFKSQTAEMLWQSSTSQGRDSDIFTSVLFNMYQPPKELCFDEMCDTDLTFTEAAAWEKLVEFMEEETKVYKTNNIILTMGGDFHYTNAESWFKNLDKLIKYGNNQQSNGSYYNLIYSTPSCYLKAVHDEAKVADITWPVKTDDFFPYAMERDAYWTGFYTSRPTLKRFERMGNNFLQVCKQLFVLGNINTSHIEQLNSLRTAMGVLQHHDAVSGTEQQHVANDYAKKLAKGFEDCETIASEALHNLLTNQSNLNNTRTSPFTSCLLANISQCKLTEESNNFVVTIYNPLSRSINHYVRIPVTRGNYIVTGPKGKALALQMVPIPTPVLRIPGRKSRATIELVFYAHQIPPLGFKSFYVRREENAGSFFLPRKRISDKKVSLRISKKNGLLSKVIVREKALRIRQELLYYESRYSGPRPSGAYIFQPTSKALKVAKRAQYAIHKGELVTEVHQIFNNMVSQVIRLYQTENFVELQWLVGLYGKQYGDFGRDFISRFTTRLRTNSTFFTDSNGREMQKRVRNFRPTWELNATNPVSANYYPVTSKILMRDCSSNVEVAILTDRAQGGTSLMDGELELMVHRNSKYDDRLGVEQPLDEKAFQKPLVARGSHYLFFGSYTNQSKESLAAQEKDLAQRKLLEAWTFLAPTNESYDVYSQQHKMKYSGLNYDLPKNVQILTLEPWGENRFLLRLEHTFEVNEDPKLSKPAIVNLENLFAAFKIKDLRETTLGGNQWLDESNPMKFDTYMTRQKPFRKARKSYFNNALKISLSPMQIRTFIVTIRRAAK